MSVPIVNIHRAEFQQQTSAADGKVFKYLDLSGDHLGVRIEELPPGAVSSRHHYHTAEEEHVLMMAGSATLYLADKSFQVAAGDHICFVAGDGQPHHLQNTSSQACTFLVFGERKQDDVVFYPKDGVMLVKSAAGNRQYTYTPRDGRGGTPT